MSLEHSPAKAGLRGSADAGPLPNTPPNMTDYWYGLIDEKAAAGFLAVTDRTMQKMRQRGGGPLYVLISSRCLKYRRIDLRDYAESRMRKSTSDPGRQAA